jgi:hypothetical protein
VDEVQLKSKQQSNPLVSKVERGEFMGYPFEKWTDGRDESTSSRNDAIMDAMLRSKKRNENVGTVPRS